MEISLKKIIFVQDISNAKLMEFKKLIDREAELERMNEALHRQGGRIKMRSPPKVLTGNFHPSQLSSFLS